jgi:hypothetical protein
MPLVDIGPHSNQLGGFLLNRSLLNLRGLPSILQMVSTIAPCTYKLQSTYVLSSWILTYSVNRAARGEDQRIDPNQDLRAYDRDDDCFYPYKSHGQYLRAWYGMCGCFLIVLFNGWQSFVSPMSIDDFLASYINVSPFIVLR